MTISETLLKTIVHKQLSQSISTLQAVLADGSIAASLGCLAETTASSMRCGGKLLVAGNGGSAADAQHLVAEFVGRLNINRAALPAIALTTDSSIITAIGNDFTFDNVFSRQIEAIGAPGDVFLGISTSGNSKNILCALRQAKTQGLVTVGFTGNGGGQMLQYCDHTIIIPSTNTMNIQESHLALEHIFCMLVEFCYFGPSFGS